MPRCIVAGNWKMNTTLDEAAALASEVAAGAPDSNNVEIILCPPFISLAAVRQAVSGSPVMVGAQNMYFELRRGVSPARCLPKCCAVSASS